MAINSEEKMIQDGGDQKKSFLVTFTNGTLEQLEELKTFFKASDKLDVIKLGISVLQRAKETQEKKDDPQK